MEGEGTRRDDEQPRNAEAGKVRKQMTKSEERRAKNEERRVTDSHHRLTSPSTVTGACRGSDGKSDGKIGGRAGEGACVDYC